MTSATTTKPIINPFKLSSFSTEKHKYMMRFDVENWYNAIQSQTFETYIESLSREEGRAMAKMYKSTKVDPTVQLNEDDVNYLKSAKDKISGPIEQLRAKGKSSFVRLNTRSPKDAGLDGSAHLKQLLNNEISQFKQQGVIVDANIKLQSLFNASARLMEVTNADQAMQLLLSSERIYHDLCTALDQDESLWGMKFIVREYVKLDVSHEFRGFVCNKRLTALSQYNDLCFYSQLKGKELDIVDKIFDFFNANIRDHLPYEAYVIDFVVIDEQVKVIEINPFGPVTGASLFSWTDDKYLLQGGVDVYNDLHTEINLPSDTLNKGAKEPLIAEFTTTANRAYDGGWKTLLRLYNRLPDKVNSEYINIVYGDILKSKGGGTTETFQKIFKADNNNCVIL